MVKASYYFIIAILIVVFVLLSKFVFKQKLNDTKSNIYKVFSLTLALVFYARYLLGDATIETVFMLTGGPDISIEITAVTIILTWLTYATVLLIILYPFFNVKNLTNLIKFFVLPIALINLVFLLPNITAITGTSFVNLNFRAILMSIEIAIILFYSVLVLIKTGYFKITKTEVKNLLLSILPVIICTMPAYALRALFGNGNPTIEVLDFTIYHRIFIYAGILIPLGMFFVLHKLNKDAIKFAILYYSLGVLLIFMINFKADTLFTPMNWPLHLCNTAMYIVVICLIFHWEKLFYFSFFINVLGAFLAMLMPNYGALNITSTNLVVFWVNHFTAFFLPIVIVALKIYPRPKLKQFIYSLTAFTIYFVFIIFINAWFTNYGTSDFFFVNSDFVAEKLGRWAEDIRLVVVSFNIGNLNFTFYPLYQFLFFLVYVATSFGMWFIYEQSYVFFDQLGDIFKRKAQLKMDKFLLLKTLGERGANAPMNKEEINKLVLNNFSKKYSSSKVFAVEDANLEVNGGEIFGFLGPNGSGKSTIIKSIVGIQPITSGTISVCGYDVDKQSVQAKQLVGYVPDHYALYEKLTGREYINYIADLYQVNLKDRNTRMEKYLKIFALEQAFDNQMKTYSHGMKQKIAIMSALIHEPKLWILDEPLTGLDPNSIFEVKECMKEHAKKGNIVFFSSHIIDVVERICDKIAIIKQGKIIDTADVKKLEKQNVILEDYYLKVIGSK
ncbi:MAG: ATP-binding cassette domain-containing protein [Clostridia bacterium]